MSGAVFRSRPGQDGDPPCRSSTCYGYASRLPYVRFASGAQTSSDAAAILGSVVCELGSSKNGSADTISIGAQRAVATRGRQDARSVRVISRKENSMRKLIVSEFMTLDGVMQAPGARMRTGAEDLSTGNGGGPIGMTKSAKPSGPSCRVPMRCCWGDVRM